MKNVFLLLLVSPLIATAQVPISPIGPLYTQAQPIASNGTLCATPTMIPVTFTWTAVSGAPKYEVIVVDGCTLPPAYAIHTYKTPSDLGCVGGGTCSYTTAGAWVANGLTAIWQVRVTDAAGNGLSAWTAPVSFQPNPAGLNTYQEVPCSWYYVTDAPGQGRRIIDFNTARGGQAFPMYQWLQIDASDLVPPGTNAIQVLAHFIFSVSTGTPILSYKTRRHGSTYDPEPYGGLMYSTSARDPQEKIILLGADRKFDFYWSDTANGHGPALDGAGVASAWAVNMTVTGYCK